jgi:SAM-dependent methyltransferase
MSAILTGVCLAATAGHAGGAEEEFTKLVRDSGVRGGLVVHVGSGDGQKTALLRLEDCYVVHGLDTEAANVEKARTHLRSKGVYGKVSVDQWDGVHLPYTDNVVNLVIAASADAKVTAELARRLVAVGDKVYVTLGYHKPIGGPERRRGDNLPLCAMRVIVLDAEPGPAYQADQSKAGAVPVAETDWPTYRRDAARSGSTKATVGTAAKPHLFTVTGFLDDAWWHRAYWIYGAKMDEGFRDWAAASECVPNGQIMVFNDDSAYGFRRDPIGRHGSHVGLGLFSFRLFAADKAIVKDKRTPMGTRPVCRWGEPVAVVARALVLAGPTLWVAGPPRRPGPHRRPGRQDQGPAVGRLGRQGPQTRGSRIDHAAGVRWDGRRRRTTLRLADGRQHRLPRPRWQIAN